MKQYIDKSALVAEIERRISLFKEEKKIEKWNAVNVISLGVRIAMLEELLSFLDTLEVKEVDLEKEKVENIKKQCPFRKIVCNKYQNHPLRCSGACAFVSDRITLEKKHICNV